MAQQQFNLCARPTKKKLVIIYDIVWRSVAAAAQGPMLGYILHRRYVKLHKLLHLYETSTRLRKRIIQKKNHFYFAQYDLKFATQGREQLKRKGVGWAVQNDVARCKRWHSTLFFYERIIYPANKSVFIYKSLTVMEKVYNSTSYIYIRVVSSCCWYKSVGKYE